MNDDKNVQRNRPFRKPDKLLLEEVAEECRSNVRTVRYWIRTGRLKSIKPGRRRLVLREDLNAFLYG